VPLGDRVPRAPIEVDHLDRVVGAVKVEALYSLYFASVQVAEALRCWFSVRRFVPLRTVSIVRGFRPASPTSATLAGASASSLGLEIIRPTLGFAVRPFGIAPYYGQIWGVDWDDELVHCCHLFLGIER
jgi:hypothetical protein